MITDFLLGTLILCDFLLLMFCIILCFIKAPSWLEFEYVFKAMCGLLLLILNYSISQFFINGNATGAVASITDISLGTFFFWFMGGFSLLYVLMQVIMYVLEKLTYAASAIETNVNKSVKKDMATIEEDMNG
jgi:hypothetical protein